MNQVYIFHDDSLNYWTICVHQKPIFISGQVDSLIES